MLVKLFKKSIAYPQVLVVAVLFCLLQGCGKDNDNNRQMPPPPVSVVEAKAQNVPIYLEYIGETQSVQTVDIRARVEGFLEERNFTEGDDVALGELLFVIDPRPFIASLAAAEADVLSNQANVRFWELEFERSTILLVEGAISQEEYDQTLLERDQAVAQLELSQANLEIAALDLSYTTMVSPVNGRVSNAFVDVGNLVGGLEQTMLANVVQLDPMRVLFNPNDHDYLLILKELNQGKTLDASVSLGSDVEVTYDGKLNFVNNSVEPGTATLLMRVLVENQKYQLLPGMFVNVKLHLKDDPNAILLPPEAVIVGQGFDFVYVVDADNTANQQQVQRGPMYKQQQVVLSGLKDGDKVIVDNLQKVRPGNPVTIRPASSTQANEHEKKSK